MRRMRRIKIIIERAPGELGNYVPIANFDSKDGELHIVIETTNREGNREYFIISRDYDSPHDFRICVHPSEGGETIIGQG